MAFTDNEILDLAAILNTTPPFLASHLLVLGTDLTLELETRIRFELIKWLASDAEPYVKIHPNTANRGLETFPDTVSGRSARRIALWLDLYSSDVYSSGMGTIRISSGI